MKRMMAVLVGLGVAGAAFAHPHAWVDVLVTPQTTTDGKLSVLEMQWSFDPFYAQVMLEEVQAAENQAQFDQRWADLERDIQNTLSAVNFYVNADSEFAAGTGKLRVTDGELFLDVDLPLRQPVEALHYRIYEPTYYVEMLHSPEQAHEWANGCHLQLEAANPSEEKVAEAYALDFNAQGEANLGRYFAESGELTCR